MALCTDRSLTYLNELGYNVVRLPRRGLEPLDVLGRDGRSLERLGRLDQIWDSSRTVPQPSSAQQVSNISGQQTSAMSLSIGLRLLNGVLAAIGAKLPRVDFAYANASTMQFTFGDVSSRGVSPFEVGEFLGTGDVKGGNPIFDRYFHDDDTEAFVLVEVLEAKSISVSARDHQSGSINADIAAIQQVVGANVHVEAKVGSGNDLTFSGEAPVTFGFKAFQIAFDGHWRVTGAEASEDLAFDTHKSRPTLLQPGRTLALRGSFV